MYRGRLAPSPTGALHLGIARTALCAWLRARSLGGELVLRVEDLDGPRVVAGSADAIARDLRWLGLSWDEGPDIGGPHAPYIQSQRSAAYDEAFDRLVAHGLVYPCTCSRKEIAEIASAPHGDLGPLYPGTCRNGAAHSARKPAWRFRMPSPAETFTDVLHNEYTAGVADDFVVRRGDGVYAYQLAVVVDDIAMRVREVVRGDDLLSSTPRQLALYRALAAEPPRFLHVPLLLDAEGRKLSKRDGAVSVSHYRAAGVSAPQLLGLLGQSLGLCQPGERPTAPELVPRFDAQRLSQTATRLDLSSLEPCVR